MEFAEGGQHFLAMEDREDSMAGSSQCTYFSKPSAETSAEYSRRLTSLSKRKQRSQSTAEAMEESKKRTRRLAHGCVRRHHMHVYS